MKPSERNLFFIGLMGAGKTTVGRQVAQSLARPFYDSDLVVCERTGVSVPTIFELEGEEGFRQRETAVIDELTRRESIVLATGGGAVMRDINRHCLCTRGTVIYLHARPEVLFERTRYDKNRPLLQVDNPLDKLRELYAVRDAVYRAAAHHIVEAENGSHQQTARHILKLLRQEN